MSARNQVGSFTNRQLAPAVGKLSRVRARFGSKASFLVGALLAVITSASVNEVQTLAYTGTGTTGTFTLTFDGQATAALAYGATAAQVQAALRALPGVGQGFTCTGGPLNTGSIVITASGSLVGQDIPLITVTSNSTDFTTLAVTTTTSGRGQGSVIAWDSSVITNPSTGVVTPSGTGAGGTWAAGGYLVQAAWRNAQGSTLPGLPVIIALTASQSLRIAALNAAATPDDATYLDIFVNGLHAKAIAVTTPGTGGNVVQTDIAGPAEGTGLGLPTANTAFINGDGRQTLRGFSTFDVQADVAGRIMLGTNTNQLMGGASRDGELTIGGVFRLGDTGLSALTAAQLALALSQLGGRVIQGVGYGDNTSLVSIPGYVEGN